MRKDVGTVRSASALDREHTKARTRTPYRGSPCSDPMRTAEPPNVRMSSGLGAAAVRGAAFVTSKAAHPQTATPTAATRMRNLITSSLHRRRHASNHMDEELIWTSVLSLDRALFSVQRTTALTTPARFHNRCS